jgi:DNA topoisomerase-1
MKLGVDPAAQKDVLLMRGPYGFYVQLGPTDPDAESKPKRAAWPKNIPVATADLDTALKLLSLPRQLGEHPQTGKPVEASIGPFGPYVKHDGGYKSIPKSDSVYDITLERALQLLAAPKTARGATGKPLGAHPDDQKPITLMSGRYGPYVKHGQVNATVPRDYDSETLTFEQALEILAAKSARPAPPTRRIAAAGSTRAAAARHTARAKPAKGEKSTQPKGAARPAAKKRAATKTQSKTRASK